MSIQRLSTASRTGCCNTQGPSASKTLKVSGQATNGVKCVEHTSCCTPADSKVRTSSLASSELVPGLVVSLQRGHVGFTFEVTDNLANDLIDVVLRGDSLEFEQGLLMVIDTRGFAVGERAISVRH